MSADELLRESTKHLALIGKFTVEGDDNNRVRHFPASKAAEELRFELRYSRVPLTIDGKTTFEAFRIVTPRDADGPSKPLPISRTPLEQALGKPGQDIREVGGQLYRELLDKLDALAPFWHPAFDRQITEGFWRFTQGLSKANETFTDGTRRRVLYSPAVNRALLAYVRARESDAKQTQSAVETALKEDSTPVLTDALHELLVASLLEYRQRLGTELPMTGLIHQRVEDQKGWKEWVRNQPIPKHAGKSLPQLYRAYREAAEVVENISRCEPLIALMIMWYFSKITPADSTDKIAKAIYEQVYEKDGTWKPRLSPEQQDEDQETFRATMMAQYAAVVEAERGRGGESSPKAIVFKLYLRAMVDHRAKTWRVSRCYDRDGVIADTTRRFQALAAETIEGVQELLGIGRDVLDGLKGVYQDFEAQYAEPGKITDTLTALLDKLPVATFGEWKAAFQKENAKKQGKELADAFREGFNEQVAKVAGEEAAKFLKAHGDKIEEKLNLVSTIYRAQLRGALEKPGAISPAGSLGGVRDPDHAETQPPASHGAEQEFRRLVQRVGASHQAEPPNPVKPPPAGAQKGGGNPKDTVSAAALSDRFEVDFGEETLKARYAEISGGNADAGVDPLSMIAKVLDHYDGVVEGVREGLLTETFLGDGSKAPSRGTLRSTLLGEFFLTAPGEVSPLGQKDTSLGVALLLGMTESVGAATEYEGENRQGLVRPVPDLACGVRDAGLPSIWQISKGKDGLDQLEALVAFWSKLASEVFSVREYIADMKEASKLLDAVRASGGRVTIVNDTVEGHVEHVKEADGDLFCSVRPEGHPAPPSVVFVSRQACKKDPSLQPLADALMGTAEESVISRLHNLGKEMGRWVSLPLFVAGRSLSDSDDRLPHIAVEIPEAYLLAVYLIDPKCPALKEKLGRTHGDFEKKLKVHLGEETTWSQLWQKYVDKNPADVLTSKALTHALFQRCLGQIPSARDAVFGALEGVESILGPKLRGNLAIQGDGGKWREIPADRKAVGNMSEAVLAVKQAAGDPLPIEPLKATFPRI